MPNKNCMLPFALFFLLSLVVVLQTIGFFHLLGTVCKWVPSEREYCIEKIDEENNTITSKEQNAYYSYQWLTGISIIFEFLAFCTVCSRIYYCVDACCVPMCHDCWKCCFECGNGWVILLIIGVILCFAGQIVIGAGLPVGDVAPYIKGFRYNLASLVFGVLLICGWIAYLCKYGCPPDGYFLGSDKVFSDYAVITTPHTQRVQKRNEQGNLYWTDEVTKTHRLVRKGNSNRVGPDSTSHM